MIKSMNNMYVYARLADINVYYVKKFTSLIHTYFRALIIGSMDNNMFSYLGLH